MKKGNLSLGKVKLVNGGMKGLEATYQQSAERGDYIFNDDHKSTFKAPVPKHLLDLFAKLKEHFVYICRFDSNNGTKEAIEITGVCSNGSSHFIITAKVKTFGNTTFGVSTPKITEDKEYNGFDSVIEIINDIYDGVTKYINDKEVADNKQIVMGFSEAEEDISVLSDSEAADRAREYLEKQGAIVMMEDDYDKEVDEEASSETINETKEQTEEGVIEERESVGASTVEEAEVVSEGVPETEDSQEEQIPQAVTQQ